MSIERGRKPFTNRPWASVLATSPRLLTAVAKVSTP